MYTSIFLGKKKEDQLFVIMTYSFTANAAEKAQRQREEYAKKYAPSGVFHMTYSFLKQAAIRADKAHQAYARLHGPSEVFHMYI